jgi:hypothetical protein
LAAFFCGLKGGAAKILQDDELASMLKMSAILVHPTEKGRAITGHCCGMII